MKSLSKQGVSGLVFLASGVFSLIGGIIYAVSGTTGYLFGTPFNSLPLVLMIIAAVLTVATVLFGDRFQMLVPYVKIAAGVLLVFSLCLFAIGRVPVVQEMLIPNAHSPELRSAYRMSIIGGIMVLLAIISTAVSAFIGNPDNRA